MTRRDVAIYAAAGLAIWMHGAITFRLGGRMLFGHGLVIIALVGGAVAVLVCMAFRFTMSWRKGNPTDAASIAVIMALPGLFGETARQVVFPWATGLPVGIASAFATVIFFGNAVLLTCAVAISRRAVNEYH